MASIEGRRTQDGKTCYRVKIRLKGHPEESATFSRKTDARRWAQATETAIREGRYFRTREAMRKTLNDLIERYIQDVLPQKPRSQIKQTYQLEWWRSELGSFSIAEIVPARIAEKRDQLAREETYRGSRRSPATVNRYLAALSHAFTIAVKEWGWADENPVRKVAKLREPRGRVRYLSDDERDRLLPACQASSDPRLYPLVMMALSTGARQGEILKLKWSDVDLKRGVAVLHDTKNQERRALPLTGLALNEIAELGRVRQIDTDLVFADLKGNVGFPRNAWEAALKEAEIEDFRFHDLRHSAASYLAMSGATLAEIAEVLGHKTLQMVKRYSHLTEQHTSKVVARMNEKFLGGRNPR